MLQRSRLRRRAFRRPHPAIVAWAASVPVGTSASAGTLLPGFLDGRPRRLGSMWSSHTLGISLARLFSPAVTPRPGRGAARWTWTGRPAPGLPWG